MTHGISSERPRPGNRGRKSPKPPQATSLFDVESTSGGDRAGGGLPEGRRRRDEGRTVAYAASAAPWTVRADRWLLDLEPGTEVTADDLAREVGHPTGGSAQAVGGWWARNAKKNRIGRVGYRQSERPSRHASVISVWVRTEVST